MKRNDVIIKKEYLKNLLPMILSVLGGTINTFIDSIFVSQTVGSEGLAAVNLSLPVYLVMCVIGALIGGGASVASARYMGKDRTDKAEEIFDIAWTLLLISGAVITIAGAACVTPISRLLSQNGQLYEYVKPYMFVTLLGAIPNMLVYLVVDYLQLEGKMRQIKAYMIIMTATDVILDYVFMVPLGMGMGGAALASVAASTAACIYGFIRLETGYTNFRLHLHLPDVPSVKRIIADGSPIAMGNACDTFKVLVINAIILEEYGTIVLSGQAILFAMAELSLAILSGVTVAAGPMIGIFVASRENESIKALFKMQMKAGLIMTGIFAVLLVVMEPVIQYAYCTKHDLQFGLICLGIGCILDVFGNTYCTYISRCNRPVFANVLIILRRFLVSVVVLEIMILAGTDPEYIWLYIPAAALFMDVIILIAVTAVYLYNRSKGMPLTGILMLDDRLVRENKVLDFSIVPTEENICDAAAQISQFCEINNMPSSMTLKLGMAIEELLTVIAGKNDNLESVDLRVYHLEGNTGLRVRCPGVRYNPFDADDDDDYLMGIRLLEKMSDVVNYNYALGLNNISVILGEAK